MYEIKYHPLIEEDLSKLNNSIRIEVFKKLKKIQISPEIGQLLGNKNNMDLTGLRKVYVAKKQVRIVYEIIDNILVVKIISIGRREDMEVYKQAEKKKSYKATSHNCPTLIPPSFTGISQPKYTLIPKGLAFFSTF